MVLGTLPVRVLEVYYLHDYLQTLKISTFVSVPPKFLWLSKYIQAASQTVEYYFLFPYLQIFATLLLM